MRTISFLARMALQPVAGLRRIVAAVFLCAGLMVGYAQQSAGDDSDQWETLTNCVLLMDEFVDGDSFQAEHEGRKYIFRLYFVDAPESDATLRERVQDQAAYFGITDQDVPRAGKLAAKFVREKLSSTPFTITTRWQNAMGRSSLARFYCGLTVNEQNLAEELVANGLARIYGIRANFPKQRSTTFINKLKNLELSARENKLGVWNEEQFPRITRNTEAAPTSRVITTNEPAAASTTTGVDLNTATREELMKLSGVGKVMAERIIAHRPFASVEELDDVPGVGPKTMDKLRPLASVAPAKAAPGSE